MSVKDIQSAQEQYREASFQVVTNINNGGTAYTVLLPAIFTLIATFVCDVSQFDSLIVWVIRWLLGVVFVIASVFAIRFDSQVRAARKIMISLKKNYPDIRHLL